MQYLFTSDVVVCNPLQYLVRYRTDRHNHRMLDTGRALGLPPARTFIPSCILMHSHTYPCVLPLCPAAKLLDHKEQEVRVWVRSTQDEPLLGPLRVTLSEQLARRSLKAGGSFDHRHGWLAAT